MKQAILYLAFSLLGVVQTFAQTTTTYEYDGNNRLSKVAYSDGATVVYTYDALGNRMTKTVSAGKERYTLTLSATPANGGSVQGGGSYYAGSLAVAKATPNEGFDFFKWSDGETTNPRTLTITGNMTLEALFSKQSVKSGIVGDIVVDGIVDEKDLNMLYEVYLGNELPTDACDVDGDGSITVSDITMLIAIVNHIETPMMHNGHQYVDLSLPSGTLWATCNIGAAKPEQRGNYYAWGEVETKDTYSWETYKWSNYSTVSRDNHTLCKYVVEDGYGTVDNRTMLETSDDAAAKEWGGEWQMPNEEQMQELIYNCTIEQTTVNGVKGYRFTANNGRSIFMPAAGYTHNSSSHDGSFNYWLSPLWTQGGHSTNAYQLQQSGGTLEVSGGLRYDGCPIRPVIAGGGVSEDGETRHRGHNMVDLGLPSGTLWATCNVGANQPEDYGDYYAWGETTDSGEGKDWFAWRNYKYNNDLLGNHLTKYNNDSSLGDNGFTDNLTVLEPSDDAASSAWGGYWRMPTRDEALELFNKDYTSWEWTVVKGVAGHIVRSKIEGYTNRSIFLPATGWFSSRYNPSNQGELGYYWTATLGWYSNYGCSMEIQPSKRNVNSTSRDRCTGLSVRPVVSKADLK